MTPLATLTATAGTQVKLVNSASAEVKCYMLETGWPKEGKKNSGIWDFEGFLSNFLTSTTQEVLIAVDRSGKDSSYSSGRRSYLGYFCYSEVLKH